MHKLTFLILILFFSCASDDTQENHEINTEDENIVKDESADLAHKTYHFIADSAFLNDFQLHEEHQVDSLRNPVYGTRESMYSYIKTKAIYHEIERFDINEEVFGRIVVAQFPEVPLDGTMKLFFLVTYSADDSEIDCIRLSKYEQHADVFYLETAIIHGWEVKRKIQFEGIGEDGSVVDTFSEETYTIDQKGQINRAAN